MPTMSTSASRNRTDIPNPLLCPLMVAVRHRLRFPPGTECYASIAYPLVRDNAVSRNGIAQTFKDFDLLRQALFKIRVIRANELLIALATPAKILLPSIVDIGFETCRTCCE